MSRLLRKPPVVVGGVLAAVLIPFVVTGVNLLKPRPYVVLDWAQTELRVRAVFSAHPPLIGLPGRIGEYGVHIGSHPGPISFYVLAPFYKLFGSDPWALFAAALSVNFLWICVALWLGWRRGGLPMLVGIGILLLTLVHTFGMEVLSSPWNPYLPLMAWTVVLLAAWSVLCDDIKMLPVLVGAATYCMQIHLPYLGLGGGVLVGSFVVTVVWALWRWRRGRSDRESRVEWLVGERARRPSLRGLSAWTGVSFVVGALLWLPPVAEQIRSGADGNLHLIWNDLAHAPEPAGGLSQGIHQLLTHLNAWAFLTGHTRMFTDIDVVWPGVVLLIVWSASVVVAWRNRLRSLVILDAVIAGVLVLAVASLSKIYGPVHWYLALWAWSICGFMLAATGWSAIVVIRRRSTTSKLAEGLNRSGVALATVAIVSLSVLSTVDATTVRIIKQNLSNQMAVVVPPTLTDIEAGRVPGDTGRGRYVVTWTDSVNLGSGAYTLLDEMDRHDIPAGLRPAFRGIVPDRDLVPDGTERGIVHLAVGRKNIEEWRAKPGVVEVAHYDGRTAAEKAEYARLRREVERTAREAGEDPLAIVDNPTTAALNSNLPTKTKWKLNRMADIGLPVAVFLAPPTP